MRFLRVSAYSLILLTFLTAVAAGTVHRVRDDFATIQQAIQFAAPSDTVLVEPDFYPEILDFLGKDIVVASWFILKGDTSYVNQTVVDPGGLVTAPVVTFANGETSGARLTGLTVTGGTADMGGGIYCVETSPILDHLVLQGNTATFEGGGLYAYGGLPLIADSRIEGNWCLTGDGGGVWAQDSGIRIERCEILDNHADYRGAGVFCEYSWPTVSDCRIIGNIIESDPPEYCYGGGVVSRRCVPVITDNYIAQNHGGGFGGGVFH